MSRDADVLRNQDWCGLGTSPLPSSCHLVCWQNFQFRMKIVWWSKVGICGSTCLPGTCKFYFDFLVRLCYFSLSSSSSSLNKYSWLSAKFQSESFCRWQPSPFPYIYIYITFIWWASVWRSDDNFRSLVVFLLPCLNQWWNSGHQHSNKGLYLYWTNLPPLLASFPLSLIFSQSPASSLSLFFLLGCSVTSHDNL